MDRILKIWWRRLWWVEIWLFFYWWWEYHPNPPNVENTVVQKFSKPIRMLDYFTKKFSRKALLVFCLPGQDYDWNLQNKFWLLMVFGVLCRCVSLKVKLMFLHIYKYVSASCLSQFTLYIVYYLQFTLYIV